MTADKKFDFEEFSTSIIKVIDSIRSKGNPISSEPVEHRINAFYRALGLPAIILNDSAPKSIQGNNNGNFFTTKEFGFSDTDSEKTKMLDKLNIRKVIIPIDAQKIENFLDHNEFSILDGITEDSAKKRTSGGLFPMVVNGEIEVWPINRRVAPAFTAEKNLYSDKTKFSRPFIETVLSLRLKNDSLNNTQQSSEITKTVSKKIEDIGKEIAVILKYSENYVKDIVQTAVEKANKARRFLGYNVVPGANTSPNQKPKTEENSEKVGEIEKQLSAQNLERDKETARLSIFDFEDTYGGEDSITKNLKAPLFANDFLRIVIKTNQSEKCIKETTEKLEKHKKLLIEASKELDLVLGTYSGLSGTDILAIIISLFEVDLGVLFGLLNDLNKKNLKIQRGIEDNTVSVRSALKKLEEKVKEVLERIDKDIQDSTLNEKSTNKKK